MVAGTTSCTRFFEIYSQNMRPPPPDVCQGGKLLIVHGLIKGFHVIQAIRDSRGYTDSASDQRLNSLSISE